MSDLLQAVRTSSSLPYTRYSYLYPPRPENAVEPAKAGRYEGEGYVAQPKLDGSSCLVFTDGSETVVMSRHAEPFSVQPKLQRDGTLGRLHRGDHGKWTVLVGELMNKSKTDERGIAFSDRYVIHDVLVLDGVHLVGSTFGERIALLDRMYGAEPSDQEELLSTPHKGVYRVRTHDSGFGDLFARLTSKAQMYEGIVLKDATAPLENGARRGNTRAGQAKIRRPVKNYQY